MLIQAERMKMGITMEIPKEYGYVVLVLVLYNFLNIWMSFQVGKARKKYRVPYPNLYASEQRNNNAHVFNCIQRGHQNSLEFMPVFFVMLLLGGLQYPLVAAGLGGLYIIGRFFYFRGYSTGVPENRYKLGRINFFALLGLIYCTASFGVNLVLE